MASVQTRCPVCFKSVAHSALEQHVNACLDGSVTATTTIPTPTPTPIPTPTPTPYVEPPSVIDEQAEALRRAAERRAQEERDRQLALQVASLPEPARPSPVSGSDAIERVRRDAEIAAQLAARDREQMLRERVLSSTRTTELEQWYNQLLRLPDTAATREQMAIVRQQLEELTRAELAREARLRQLEEEERLRREALARQEREDAALAQRLALEQTYAFGFPYAHVRHQRLPPVYRHWSGTTHGLFNVRRPRGLDHCEWSWVANQTNITFDVWTIRSMRRNQNPALWDRFLTYRATVHNGEVMLLFARISSAETNPNVCRTGLTLASHGSRGAQGHGFYFTSNPFDAFASSSDSSDDSCELLVCRVAVGRSFEQRSAAASAPGRTDPPADCDSVHTPPSTYVVYNPAAIYPEYLVQVLR